MLIYKFLDFVEIKKYLLNLDDKDTINFNSAKRFLKTNLFYHFSYNYFHILR